jgi:hypothetical protein
MIMRTAKLGGLTVNNDIEACRQALNGAPSGRISEIDGGISISL